MGMSGNYIAMYNTAIEGIMSGEILLNKLNPDDYYKLDIDKTWEAIHFMLCGERFDGEPPLGYVVPMLLDRNVDYGEYGAFCVLAEEVSEAYEQIANMDKEQLRQRYDFPAMEQQQIYPIIEDEDGDELFEYIWSHFTSIQAYFKEVVKQGKGIIFYVL